MMIQRGNPAVIEPGMVFFMHMILLDSERGMTICSGETVAVTDNGCERLTKSSLDLVVN
jgi:Xaa-Pro dipeptidase